jgi:hypothetical protein
MRLHLHLSSSPVAMLFIMTAVACGGRSDDDGGAGASAGTGGTSSTGGMSGSGGVSGSTGNGSGGVGGTTGGIAGGAGTGGTGTGGTGGFTGDSGNCGCVGGHVGWGMNGGHVAYQDSSALEVCNLFVHTRAPVSQDPPAVSCEQQISNCAGALGPGDVMRAIAHADVKTAIAAAPVLFGEDPRAFDGAVLRIQIGTAVIEVGNPCKVASCKPIPAGVSALASMLQSMTKQELSRSPCCAIFPPPQ